MLLPRTWVSRPTRRRVESQEGREQVRPALHRRDLSRLLVVARCATGQSLTAEQKKAQQASEDIEVGYFYMNKKNFRAAESRLQEAVELKPDAVAAWVGLAQAQQQLGKNEDSAAEL